MLAGEHVQHGVMVPSGLRKIAPEPVYTYANGYLPFAEFERDDTALEAVPMANPVDRLDRAWVLLWRLPCCSQRSR